MNDVDQLLSRLMAAIESDPPDAPAVAKMVREMLELAVELDDRASDVACQKVSFYIILNVLDGGRVEKQIEQLPPELYDIVSLMGHFLHDVHSAPEIAANFGGMPAQLLARLDEYERRLHTG